MKIYSLLTLCNIFTATCRMCQGMGIGRRFNGRLMRYTWKYEPYSHRYEDRKHRGRPTEQDVNGSKWDSDKIYSLTPAGGFRLVPLWVLRIHALNHYGTLLQCVARITWEFNYRSHAVGGVTAAEVAILYKRLIAHPLCESCINKVNS